MKALEQGKAFALTDRTSSNSSKFFIEMIEETNVPSSDADLLRLVISARTALRTGRYDKAIAFIREVITALKKGREESVTPRRTSEVRRERDGLVSTPSHPFPSSRQPPRPPEGRRR